MKLFNTNSSLEDAKTQRLFWLKLRVLAPSWPEFFQVLTLTALLLLPATLSAQSYEPSQPLNPSTGPFSGGQDSPGTVDAGIPGFVGAAGDGIIPTADNGNYTNPLFVGWATGCAEYKPFGNLGVYNPGDPDNGIPAGIGTAFLNPELTFGPATANVYHIATLGDMFTYAIEEYLLNPSGTSQPGYITLTFDQVIANGTGADFAVFENGFVSNYNIPETGGTAGQGFCELGYVEVSTDGITFARFPSIVLNTAESMNIKFDDNGDPSNIMYATLEVSNIYNIAGKHCNGNGPSWGTPFDLDTLTDLSAALAALNEMGIELTEEQLTSLLAHTSYNQQLIEDGLLDVNNINYVRVVDIPGNGMFTDSLGNPIYDAWPTWGSGGFDLDAIGVINTVNTIPEPSTWALMVAAAAGLLVVGMVQRRSGAGRPFDFAQGDGGVRMALGDYSHLMPPSPRHLVSHTPRHPERSVAESKDRSGTTHLFDCNQPADINQTGPSTSLRSAQDDEDGGSAQSLPRACRGDDGGRENHFAVRYCEY
ncbi:MAG: hypothetical protein LBK60_05665 [Verrucomicrobiales bacterium]|jgi:hypothetical protein|nr:hypothetical protein [Verrucomicrobiales bacterium]